MNDIIEAKDVYQIVEFQEQAFSHMLTDDAISWAKESQFAMQMLQSNQYLNEAAWKNKASLKNAIINVASIGISLNPALKHAYLVPRSVKKGAPAAICLDISYMGLMHLAQQTGSILWGQAKIVYAGDKYENTGIDSAPSHKSNPFKPNKDRGEVIGAYCTVKTSDGSYLTEEMNIDELNKIRDSSKASNGPWKTWPEEMMRKSVVKRASKYWPKVDRLSQAVDVINQHEGIDFQEEKDITPANGLSDCIDEFQLRKLLPMITDAGMTESEFCNHRKIKIESVESFPAARFEGCIKWLAVNTAGEVK
jgi:recombination protein RecT